MSDESIARDRVMMRRALRLAERGIGSVSPNPKVGAIVVKHNNIVGEGWHEHFGGPHAEVNALRSALERGENVEGATVYVTLEPCNHQAKTPPCTEALIAAGVKRVVYALPDPNPVASGGRARLERAGIEVIEGVLKTDAAELNAPFLFSFDNPQRPFVTLKLALSADGAIADVSRGRSEITGTKTRRMVHAMRADASAVAVGIGTALADDPELTVRFAPAPRIPPKRVIFDRRARLPLSSRLVQSAREVPVLLVTDGSQRDAENALARAGVAVLRAADMNEALRGLRERDILHLFVEGGAGVASALAWEGLIDRLVIFQSSVILGEGALHAFSSLPYPIAKGIRLKAVKRLALGDDFMTMFRVANFAHVTSHPDKPGK